MKNSQSLKMFKRVDGGNIIVDYNAGLIIEKYTTDDGTQIEDKINVNSVLNQIWDQTKSEVKVEYQEIPLGESEFVEKSKTLKVEKEPEGVVRKSNHEFWYAQKLHKNIDSAVNLY